MARFPTTDEQADFAAERNRVAWNLPRQAMAATSYASPDPAAQDVLLRSSSMRIVHPSEEDGLHHDATGQRLDWQGFLSVHFPGARRHDFAALTAYGAYMSSRDVDQGSARDVPRSAGTQPDSGESRAVGSWEDDGGVTRS